MIKKVLLLTSFTICFIFSSSATVYTVSNLLDNNATTGVNQGDLRWCINQVNANAAIGPHTINFNVAGTITAGSGYPALNLIAGGVTINGFSAPGWVSDPIVELRGPGYGTALSITNSAGSLIQGLVVRSGFGDPFVNIDNSANTTIRGCWIGVDLTGNAGFGVGYASGILINNSANSQVGGNLVTNPSYKIVVASMGGAVKLTGTSTGGTIRGVYSGINAAGTTALANGNNSHIDVGVGCNNTTIGGATSGDGCVLARTTGGSGILLQSNGNMVKGNYVGTNAAGTAGMAIQNHALYIKATSNNTIGGTTTAERNIFSSAGQYGILIESNSPAIARNNVFYNNLIGTTVTGNAALPNSNSNVRLKNASKNKIGGTATGQGNVISASSTDCGVYFESECDSNLVAGNMIGLGLNGTTVLVNGNDASDHGIYCNGSNSDRNSYKNNAIVTPARGSGIKLDYGGYDTISTNYIGTTASGLVVVGVGTDLTTHAIAINGLSNMIITNNVLSCSKGSGIKADGDCSNYVIQGNIVGMNVNGLGTTFGNNGTGIYFSNGTSKSNILIGGTTTAQRNIISKNGMTVLYSCTSTDGYGIIFEKTVGATISGNYIGVDATGITAAGNGGSGIMLNQGCNNIIIGGLTAGERNVICDNGKYCSGTPANVRHGIQFNQNSPATPNFQVIGNYVGIGDDGSTMLGNSEEGVSTYNTSGITVGGATAAHRNVIAGNKKGVFLQANAGNNNKVQGNYIGTDATGMLARPNNIGINIANGSSGNFIGGPNAGEGNVISGNTTDGILLEYATNTTIQQNKIGTTVSQMPLGNGTNGIHIKQVGTNGSTVNLIGSPTNTSLGNVIAFNTNNGILVEDAPSLRNQIRRNSIYCNGSARQNGINLNGLGNINISSPGPLVVPTYISAPTPGILVTNTPVGDIASSDVVEVFYDDACGTCQGKTYLGNATNSGTQWSFSPLPAASDCSPKGAAGCLSGVKNITATRTDLNGNTSEFMDCDPLYLPVSLLYFKGVKSGEQAALLSWATTSETNNAYFELLRSTDGKDFQPITKIQGAGNSSVLNSYSFTDANLQPGVYYYMLIQVDFDGTPTLSPIITINTGLAGTVEVVPNAVLSGEPVKVLNSTGANLLSVALTDMSGKILWETKTVTEVESSISTSGIAPGMYLVKINTAIDQVVKKILVY